MSALLDRRRLAFLLAAVVVFSGSLIAASLVGSEDAASPTRSVQPSSFTGIPQAGAVLGSPTAKVTLVEYADLQCPYCAEWTHRTLPVLVDEYVRTGKVRIVFRGLAFVGGVQGTPAFQVGRTGGPLELVPLNSLGPERLRPAIEAALRA